MNVFRQAAVAVGAATPQPDIVAFAEHAARARVSPLVTLLSMPSCTRDVFRLMLVALMSVGVEERDDGVILPQPAWELNDGDCHLLVAYQSVDSPLRAKLVTEAGLSLADIDRVLEAHSPSPSATLGAILHMMETGTIEPVVPAKTPPLWIEEPES